MAGKYKENKMQYFDVIIGKLCCAARSEFFLRAEPSGSEGGWSEEMKNREGVASGSATQNFKN